jgi:hypothetical protein
MQPNQPNDPAAVDPADPFRMDGEPEVSQEERAQILGQIDKVIESVRTPLENELADVRPRKRGGLFPLLVNGAAAALVVAGGFLLAGFFRVRNESITLRSAGFVSAEGSLLDTLRRESEGLLRDKEAEIVAIEQRLELMDAQTAELEERLQADIQVREDELRRRVEAELAVERARLRSEGTAGSEVDRRLREFEEQREAELQSELVRYRGELERTLEAKEQELLDSRRQLQSALQARTVERARLEAEREQREAEFKAERESLQEEASVAERRLSLLQEARREEQLLEDQLDGHYRSVLGHLAGGDLAAAEESLSRLKSLLDSASVLRVPALVQRRALNRSMADALAELIELRSVHSGAPPVGLEASAGSAAQAGPTASAEIAAEQAAELAVLRREINRLERTIEGLRAASRQRSTAAGEPDRERIAALELQVVRLKADLQVTSEEKARLERAAETAQSSAALRGRETTLTEILRYLNYLSRGTGGRDAESQVMSKAREDPLYRAVVREIQILRAGAAGTGEVAAPFVLLGTVVSASGTQVVIEPLSGERASVGAVVQIRRSDALEQETLIARGTVSQVRGGSVYARIEAILAAGQTPQNRDLVYIEPR